MIPGVDLIDFITFVGVIGVALVIFAEAGLLIGFFLPGDSLLVTAGFLTSQGVLDINIHLFVAILFFAAAAGDSVGYAFGKKVGRKVFNKPNSFLFKQENVRHAEAFYEKHGSITIVIARFIPGGRTFAPIVAGVGNMHYRTFLVFNLIGALLWAAGLTYLGYYAGAWLEAQGIQVGHYLLPIIAVIVFISLLPLIYHSLKNKKQRKAIKKFVLQKLGR